MSTKEQREHLERRLGELIERFKRDRQRHKRLAVALKALTVSLAGIVTVLLGWKEAPSAAIPPLFGNVALILGATITVVSAYEAFFDPRILWVRETVVFAKLTDLERDLSYAVAGGKDGEIGGDTLGKFKARLDAILEESLKAWLRLRGQDDQTSKPA